MKKNFILMFLYSFFFIYNVKSMIVEGKINKKKIIFKINPTDKLDSRISSDFLKTIAFKNLLEISNIEYFAKHIKPLIIKDEKEEKEENSTSKFIELLEKIIKKNKESKINQKQINNFLKKIKEKNTKNEILEEEEFFSLEEEEEEFFSLEEEEEEEEADFIFTKETTSMEKERERPNSILENQIEIRPIIKILKELLKNINNGEVLRKSMPNLNPLLKKITLTLTNINNGKTLKKNMPELNQLLRKITLTLTNINNGEILKKNMPELNQLLKEWTNVGEGVETLLDKDTIKELLGELDKILEKHSNPLIKRIDRIFDYLTIQNIVFGFSILSCLYYIIQYLNQEKIDDKYLFDLKLLGKKIGIFSLLPSLALIMGQFITNLNGTVLNLIQYNFVFIEYQKQNGSEWKKELLTHTLSFDTMSLLIGISLIIIFNKQLNEKFYFINYFFSIYIMHYIYFYLKENTKLNKSYPKVFNTYMKTYIHTIPYLCILILAWYKNKDDIDTFLKNFKINKINSIKIILWNKILKWFIPGFLIGTMAPKGLITILKICKDKLNVIYIELKKNLNNENVLTSYNLSDGLDAIQKRDKNNPSIIPLSEQEMTQDELIKEITSNFEVFIQIANNKQYRWQNEDDDKYIEILKNQGQLIALKNKLNNNQTLTEAKKKELKEKIKELEEEEEKREN